MTVHSAKGLEFKKRIRSGTGRKIFSLVVWWAILPVLWKEERRLFYVAITRAEEHCYISFAKTRFRYGKIHSAAKTVHHGFVGGLLEHTLSVVKLCDYYAGYYSSLNRDLLLTAAIFHDIGKMQELSRFPENDYTDDGQLLGHIMIGTEMISARIREIPGFPARLASELKHCILAHHGELEYGSPKKPALLEALALNFADNTDAKMETMIEALYAGGANKGWLGYNRLLETNIRKTTE